jgi:tetratricopeptide (TPR) repeat protein
MRKFARKHRTALGVTGAIVFLLTLMVGGLGWELRNRAIREVATERSVDAALREAEQLQAARELPGAFVRVRQAEAILAGRESTSAAMRRVSSRRADLKLALDLEDVWSQGGDFILKGRRFFDFDECDRLLTRLFRDYGIDVKRLPPEEAGRLIGGSSVAVELAAALDEWALAAKKAKGEDEVRWRRLVKIARIADPDALRNSLREALTRNEPAVLLEMASSVPVRQLPPGTAVVLGNALHSFGECKAAVALMRQAQQHYPADFWVNVALARHLEDCGQATRVEAIRYFTAAVALRPECIFAHNQLGIALLNCERHDEAIAEFREMMRLVPQDAHQGHYHLGNALWAKGEAKAAIAEFRKAIELRPNHGQAHNNLGGVLLALGQLDEAEAHFRQALKANPDDAFAHFNVGLILYKRGRLDEAIVALREAVRLDPKLADAHLNLASYLYENGQVEESLRAARDAVRLNPGDAMAHYDLGIALSRLGKKEEAKAAYRQAIARNPQYAGAWFNLGNTSEDLGRLDDAVAAWREAIRLDPDHVGAHNNLGLVLAKQGRWSEAIALRERVVQIAPDNPLHHSGLAWALIHATDSQVRDPARAVTSATTSVELAPGNATCWRVLGMAHYRNGEWQDAVDALIRSRKQAKTCDGTFFLAMAYWKLGNFNEARSWFDGGRRFMEKNKAHTDERHVQLYAEAAEVLGVELPGQTDQHLLDSPMPLEEAASQE